MKAGVSFNKMTEFHQQFLCKPVIALEWKKEDSEWQAQPRDYICYGIIEHDRHWYPYFFEGRRYKRGHQLGTKGYLNPRKAKLCAEAHWLHYQTKD